MFFGRIVISTGLLYLNCMKCCVFDISCGVLFARFSLITAETNRIERTTDKSIVLVLDNCLEEMSTRLLGSSTSLTYKRLFGHTAEVSGYTISSQFIAWSHSTALFSLMSTRDLRRSFFINQVSLVHVLVCILVRILVHISAF